MGKLTFVISDETETQFRQIIAKQGEYKHGTMGKAVEEAIKEWIQKHA